MPRSSNWIRVQEFAHSACSKCIVKLSTFCSTEWSEVRAVFEPVCNTSFCAPCSQQNHSTTTVPGSRLRRFISSCFLVCPRLSFFVCDRAPPVSQSVSVTIGPSSISCNEKSPRSPGCCRNAWGMCRQLIAGLARPTTGHQPAIYWRDDKPDSIEAHEPETGEQMVGKPDNHSKNLLT